MAWIMITPACPQGLRGTALLVDDDITYRHVIGEMLTEDGWDVIETSTGEDALTFSGLKGKPTLLVTDINLGGGMDGWALGLLARNQWPDIGLLFISGENQSRQQYYYLLPEVFLLKPFRRSDFLTAAAEVARIAATGTGKSPLDFRR
jgi:CheY-like chemotaxis protein